MKYLFWFISALVILQIACGVMSVPPAVNTATPYSQIDKQQLISPVPPKIKPTNASDSTSTYKTTVTAEKWLYVRSSASHYAEIVGYLMNGEQVTVIECAGVWGRVGEGRWVNTIYLSQGCE